ncbi:hypothetical protein [Streptomyces sp. NPDC088727]|uniref:hypothetical protein n=1 Tax=Streptomyces sp. NPDC088727 TaxID=3365875 RepID=UPI00380661C3
MINFAPAAPYGKNATQTAPRPSNIVIPRAIPVVPSVAATPRATTDLLTDPTGWDWRQLRDYVLRSTAERHGPQPAGDEIKTQSIFRSFVQRWGTQAGPIARFAFEQQEGFWRDAPVTISRFTKGNDPYFAVPISERLTSG